MRCWNKFSLRNTRRNMEPLLDSARSDKPDKCCPSVPFGRPELVAMPRSYHKQISQLTRCWIIPIVIGDQHDVLIQRKQNTLRLRSGYHPLTPRQWADTPSKGERRFDFAQRPERQLRMIKPPRGFGSLSHPLTEAPEVNRDDQGDNKNSNSHLN